MVVANINIEYTDDDKLLISMNLLKREDWKEPEWHLSKIYETVVKDFTKTIADVIYENIIE